jgi:hypothetical protein
VVGLASATDLEKAGRRVLAERESNWWSPLKRWFVRDSREVPVICIPPGARLRMTQIPRELRNKWALRTVEDVWFTETGTDPEKYHDAIRLGNGRVLLVQSLPERICLMVLSLGSDNSVEQMRMPVWPDEAFVLRSRS